MQEKHLSLSVAFSRFQNVSVACLVKKCDNPFNLVIVSLLSFCYFLTLFLHNFTFIFSTYFTWNIKQNRPSLRLKMECLMGLSNSKYGSARQWKWLCCRGIKELKNHVLFTWGDIAPLQDFVPWCSMSWNLWNTLQGQNFPKICVGCKHSDNTF